MPNERKARLFRNGRNQALRIPREFELEGDKLIIQLVVKRNGLRELLSTWKPDDTFPDIDDPCPKPRDSF